MNYVFVVLNMYLSNHCMLFTCGGNKEYYYIILEPFERFSLLFKIIPLSEIVWQTNHTDIQTQGQGPAPMSWNFAAGDLRVLAVLGYIFKSIQNLP